MIIIRTLQEIGDSLGVTKQAVAKYVKKGLLIRNEDGRIDIEDPRNKDFLQYKGADRRMLYGASSMKGRKPKAGTVKRQAETSGQFLAKLDLQIKLENLKAKQKENELKSMKIQEQRGILIQKDLVERLLFDTVGQIIQNLVVIPQTISDQILSLAKSKKQDKREQIILLLQKKYVEDTKKIVSNGHKRFQKAVENRIIQAQAEEKENE